MKNKTQMLVGLLLLSVNTPVMAQQSLSAFGAELLSTIVYSAVGILMAVVGFKVVDWLTPGNLAEDVAHKENRALAILAGSMILGVCLIIASVLIS